MSALPRTLRWLTWTAIVIVAVPVVLYLLAFAVNWSDEPPSPEALELAATTAREPIPDEANGYVYVLGFAVPRVGDPALVGASRAQWIRALAADKSLDVSADPYPGSAPEFEQIPDALAGVLTPCGAPDAGCVAAFDAAAGKLHEELEAQRPLIERYRTLLAHRAWQDVTSGDLRGPLASYSPVDHARRLFMLDTWLLATSGDANQVRARLDSDFAFWRMALANSDTLLSKVIAARFASRHLEWANLILRTLPAERRADGVPEAWRRPITDPERSMRQAFAGEWRLADGSTRFLKEHSDAVPPGTALDRLSTRLQLPFLQPQATSNRYATVLLSIDALLSMPYPELEASLARVPRTMAPDRGVFASVYNLLGKALSEPNPSLIADYGRVVADLEGARRAAVLTADLRVLKLPPELAGAMVALAASRDPYTGGPFVWTADPPMISFTGLERTNGTRHKFLY